MPSLKIIRRRIKSVKSTQKITQAMYMIATTKLKKAESIVKASRPFSQELLKTFKRLLAQNLCIKYANIRGETALENYSALMQKRDVKTVALVVVGSNKGLSGPYVTNIVKNTMERVHDLKNQGIDTKLFIIGQRVYNGLKRNASAEIVKLYSSLGEVITPGEAQVIAEDVAGYFVDGRVDKIEIITTEYLHRMGNSPKIWPVLPLDFGKEEDEGTVHPEMIFEPSLEEVLQKILPLYFSNRIYMSIVEAYASELSSRMTAMKSATDNADEMISNLTIQYNKARQASITQELLEVISGADALE